MKKLITIIILFQSIGMGAQDTLRVGEVYDFEIGDEFHYERTLTQILGIQVDRIFIDDKWYSSEQDTVYYKIRKNQFTDFIGAPEPTGAWYEDTLHYTNLDTFVWPRIFGPEPCGRNDTCVVEIEYNTFCDRETMKINLRTGLIDFEENSDINEYARGLGMILNSSSQDDGNTGVTTQLVYFKKGTEECGTPNFLTSTTDTNERPVSLVYPNPFSEALTIKYKSSTDKALSYQVIDLFGNIVFYDNNAKSETKIHTQDWLSGIYFVKLKNGEQTNTYKVVKP